MGCASSREAIKFIDDLELKQHNSVNDLWIRIDNKIYDLT